MIHSISCAISTNPRRRRESRRKRLPMGEEFPRDDAFRLENVPRFLAHMLWVAHRGDGSIRVKCSRLLSN